MRLLRLVLGILSIFLTAFPSAAWSLTLAELVESAKKESPALSQIKAEAASRAATARQEAAFSNPELGIEAGSKASGDQSEPVLGASLSQSLPLWGQRGGRIKVARLAETASGLQLRAGEAALVAEILSDAADLSLAQARLQELSIRQDLLQPVHDFLGSQTFASPQQKADRMVVESRLRGLEKEKSDLKAEVQTRADELFLQAGREGGPSDLVFELPDDVLFPLPKMPGSKVLLKENPEEQEAALEVKMASEQVGLSNSKALPSPDLSVAYEKERTTDPEQTWTAGLSFPLPLFDRNRHGVEAARQELSRSKAVQDRTSRGLRSKVRALAWRVEALKTSARLYPAGIHAKLRKQVLQSQSDFKKGRLPLLSYLEVEEEAAQSRGQTLALNAEILKVLAESGSLSGSTSVPAAWPLKEGASHAE